MTTGTANVDTVALVNLLDMSSYTESDRFVKKDIVLDEVACPIRIKNKKKKENREEMKTMNDH